MLAHETILHSVSAWSDRVRLVLSVITLRNYLHLQLPIKAELVRFDSVAASTGTLAQSLSEILHFFL
jgi:hypothetical protein